MRAVADTAPLLAAIDRDDNRHPVASEAVTRIGPSLVVLDTVAVELDHLLRERVGAKSARAFARALVHGEHDVAFMSSGLLERAAEIDERYADLGLGLVDATVMAYSERHGLPILTFDFRDFRATSPRTGHWKLLLSERDVARFDP